MSNSLYNYWLHFNPTGDMIFFADRSARQSAHRYLAVFRLIVSHKIEVLPAGPFRTYHHWEAEPITTSRFCFHPHRSLLAFTIAGTAFLWDYNDASRGSELTLRPFHTPTEACSKTLWLYPQFSVFEGIGFSNCGDHIVLEEYESKSQYEAASSRKSRLPTVVRMPDHIVSSNSVVLDNNPSNPIPGNVAEIATTSARNAASGLSVLSNKMVRSMDTVVDESGGVGSFSVTANKGVVQLQLSNQAEGISSQANFDLVRMPDWWEGLNSTRVAVRVPQTRGDIVQIVLNRAPRMGYSISGDSDDYLPAVIEHDAENLAKRPRDGPRSVATGIAGRTRRKRRRVT